MPARPRIVEIDTKKNILIVKTVMRRTYEGVIEMRENINVQAAGIDQEKDNAIPPFRLFVDDVEIDIYQ